jgi:hypothetical protein
MKTSGENGRAGASAMATVSGCRAIVSWNFRDMVHSEKSPLYNGVNMSQGFGPLAIHALKRCCNMKMKVAKL